MNTKLHRLLGRLSSGEMGRYEGYVTNDLSRGPPVPSLLDELSQTLPPSFVPKVRVRDPGGRGRVEENEASMTVDKEHPSAHRESTTGELGEFARCDNDVRRVSCDISTQRATALRPCIDH